jgi:predicted alpha-1,6-mannanase (GH76 family)
MSEITTTGIVTTVDTYLAMWNEEDAERRAELIERAWTADCHYVDPLLQADGRDAMSDMVAGVHELYPGHRFRRVSGVDVHHDQVRFAWALDAPDGTITVAGVDVGAVAIDGRLSRIAGFFGDPPEIGR